MTQRVTRDIVQHNVTVELPPEDAFGAFVGDLDSWWPAEYTWSQNVLETIRIELTEGGRCFERGPHGFECDWGRVLECDPPNRIRFLWQISPTRAPEPDPEKASEVDVRFEAGGQDWTRVILEHRGFARHGDGGDDYRAAMGSSQGWPYILDCYRSAVQ